jgi:DNA-binding protein Fis
MSCFKQPLYLWANGFHNRAMPPFLPKSPAPKKADVTQSPLAHAMETHLRHFLGQAGPENFSNLHAMIVEDVEMEACSDNQLRAAASLGLNRNTLRKKLTLLGLSQPRSNPNQSRPQQGKNQQGKPKQGKPTQGKLQLGTT